MDHSPQLCWPNANYYIIFTVHVAKLFEPYYDAFNKTKKLLIIKIKCRTVGGTGWWTIYIIYIDAFSLKISLNMQVVHVTISSTDFLWLITSMHVMW
jgi:hypothetical protein